jgi:hypothetical protein
MATVNMKPHRIGLNEALFLIATGSSAMICPLYAVRHR